MVIYQNFVSLESKWAFKMFADIFAEMSKKGLIFFSFTNETISLVQSCQKLRFSTTSIIQSKIQLLIVNIYFIFYEFPDVFFFKQSAILAF